VFHRIGSKKVFQEAIEQIAEAIRIGDLREGDRLPSERDLAATMGISRPTLREAIKSLVRAGVLEVRPGAAGGAYVRSEIVPIAVLESPSQMRISEVSEVLEARRLFEPRVAQLASVRASEEDFGALEATLDLQRAARDDVPRFIQLEVRFHIEIARATRNPTIVALMRRLQRRLELARDSALRGASEPEIAVALHDATLKAIMSRDPDRVDRVMDEHLSYLERRWEEESGRALLRRTPEFLLPRAEREPG
jgi:GntR family transcriptional regulator, transcriptional repressor for pyruvate dehydrogenase complex